jgi:hypothetical protein
MTDMTNMLDMGKIYKGQTALAIRLRTKVNLEFAASIWIKYRKPDGTESAWVATVYNIDRGIIEYKIQSAADLDQAGTWTLWAYVTFTDGNSAPGESVTVEVYEEGE